MVQSLQSPLPRVLRLAHVGLQHHAAATVLAAETGVMECSVEIMGLGVLFLFVIETVAAVLALIVPHLVVYESGVCSCIFLPVSLKVKLADWRQVHLLQGLCTTNCSVEHLAVHVWVARLPDCEWLNKGAPLRRVDCDAIGQVKPALELCLRHSKSMGILLHGHGAQGVTAARGLDDNMRAVIDADHGKQFIVVQEVFAIATGLAVEVPLLVLSSLERNTLEKPHLRTIKALAKVHAALVGSTDGHELLGIDSSVNRRLCPVAETN